MTFPAHFLEHLAGLSGFASQAFEEAHQGPPPTSIRLNPYKPIELVYEHTPIPWSSKGCYLTSRPSFTFDPLFHAGNYYVQEASSQLLEAFVRQSVDLNRTLRVLDLCAAPGGKSTHLLSLLTSDSLLVSNEVIRSRSGILADNLDRWGCGNAVVTQDDPSVLGQLDGFFDLVVADAPCSGSGLFRKDAEAMQHWSQSAVDHCSARQKRILKDIWPSLCEGGVLIYGTCSFSPQEDEQIVTWILEEFDAECIPIECSPDWGVTSSELGHRCWPHLMKGEGFFIAAIRKKSITSSSTAKTKMNFSTLSVSKRAALRSWWKGDSHELFEWKDVCWAFPVSQFPSIHQISSVCQPVRVGTRLGSWSRTDWIPDHALALSLHHADSIPRMRLELDESIRYLQRGALPPSGGDRGWQLAVYKEQPMGWLKNVGNRFNNYYPTHLRILKQSV